MYVALCVVCERETEKVLISNGILSLSPKDIFLSLLMFLFST